MQASGHLKAFFFFLFYYLFLFDVQEPMYVNVLQVCSTHRDQNTLKPWTVVNWYVGAENWT